MRHDALEGFKGSKGELIRFYEQKGPFYNEPATVALIEFYRKLEVELDRNERAHQQATETLRTLDASDEKLNSNLKKIH
jgi:5-bromo-4-chloroindolyl phosphate hydrolysis protein